MNKTAVKNFAIWARNKLITDIRYKAGLMGITEKGIDHPLPQSTKAVQFFDIGTKEPYAISGLEIEQRRKLVDLIKNKEEESDYKTALKYVMEEVAYTWFNRLIAIRFMEVNDYLPNRVRVLSSESSNKMEPDLVTHALDVELNYSASEREQIAQLKFESKLNDLFRMLFVKQCNALNDNLPELFEKTSDYTELLLNVSFTDKDGVVFHLVNDIPEGDFNVSKEGQIEIIGWLYQYYNTEPKDETFALLKKNVKITKERIPSATQLFTPEWIVKYMVENSLGRLWVEGHPNEELKATWRYYLEEAEQEEEVQKQVDKIREEYKTLRPEDIEVIDPAMGSGHILVYAFDLLMQIYESSGYTRRDAARSIVENNLYGLDIDTRAYQLAYFAIMMKARQYNRRILDKDDDVKCNLHVIQESNAINRNQLKYFGSHLSDMEKNTSLLQLEEILDTLIDAKEYGSIIKINKYNWALIRDFASNFDSDKQQSFDLIGIDDTKERLVALLDIAEVLAKKYDVVITNPPYMGSSGMATKLSEYVRKHYADSKSDLFSVFIEKCSKFTKNNRYQAMITQHAFMFISSFEKLRKNILKYDFVNMAHLGSRAFEEIGGEVVQTTTYIIRKSNINSYLSKFVRLIDSDSQDEKERSFLKKERLYTASKDDFSKIPGSPMAYWINRKVVNLFKTEKILGEVASVKKGLATGNVDLFIKFWHEIDIKNISFNKEKNKWYPCHKGGEFRKWYGNFEKVIFWNNDGEKIKNYVDESGRLKSRPQNLNFMLKKGIVFSKISSGGPSCRVMTGNELFDDAVQGIFMKDRNSTLCMLGILNSKITEYFLDFLNPTLNKQVYDLERITVVCSNTEIPHMVEILISLYKIDWDDYERSWDFKRHFFARESNISIVEVSEKWNAYKYYQFEKAKELEEKLNEKLLISYGLEGIINSKIKNEDISLTKLELNHDMRAFISYFIGCMFGRYSLDDEGLVYAGGLWDNSKYKIFIPDKDNIVPITDEEYFQDDIVERFVEFVKVVYGPETLVENLDFIANALGNKGNTSREVIRNYFVKDFFDDHCKTYQKRPIYWLFDSGKQNGFRALVYMHRYDEDTIGNLRIDYLHKIQRIYENEIKRMQDVIENSTDAREVSVVIKRKDKLLKQLQETKDYDEKIAHLALARTSIDLDDGVKVNYEKVQTDKDGRKLDVLAKI